MMRTFLFLMSLFLLMGCNTTRKQQQKIQLAQSQLQYQDSLMQTKLTSGIDFIASGNDPENWTLEMDFDRAFIFKTSSGIKVECPAVMPEFDSILNVNHYFAKPINQQMHILIFDLPCQPASVEKLNKLTVNGVLYQGCGQYLYNQQLHNTWILDHLDDQPVLKQDFKNGFPEMQFDLIEKKMNGYDGCNSIGSDISVIGNRIKFGPIVSTRKFCINVKSDLMKTDLLNNQLVEYYFKDDRLVFYLINDSKLYFRRKY